MIGESEEVTVLGAGLQGCCIALELARRGRSVTLVDQDSTPMNRASRRNEGKIHLGLVYAMDSSRATPNLQLKGALTFRLLLSRWLGRVVGDLRLSTGFDYVVAPDSLLPAEAIGRHYEMLDRRYAEMLAQNPDWDYLGERPDRLARRTGPGAYPVREVAAVFRTAERAVDTGQLADLVNAAVLASPRIRFLGGRRVRQIAPDPAGFRLRVEAREGPGAWTARRVVNATWESRLALDQTAGLPPAPGWVYRLKYRVVVRIDPTLVAAPSATMVVGRYGDVVIRPDATAYLSWYPTTMRGWSEAVRPPADWDAACRGDVPPSIAAPLVAEVRARLTRWYPQLGHGETLQVDAGAIVAHGRSDVDDPRSGLHDRTRVGVLARGNYVSVNPGKLTTAPLFAVAAADAICGGECDEIVRAAELTAELAA